MTKEQIKASILDFYRDCFAWGNALGFPAEKIAETLYNKGEISYGEMLAFREEEEKKNESRNK